MKTKIWLAMLSCVMTLGFSACSGSEDVVEPNKPGTSTNTKGSLVVLNIGGQQTRTALQESETKNENSLWTWEAGDKLILTDNTGKYRGTLTYGNEQEKVEDKYFGTFSGTTVNPLDTDPAGTTYCLTYMGAGNNTFNESNNTFTVDLTGFDGTKGNTGLGKADVMFASGVELVRNQETWAFENKENIVMTKQMSVVHFSFVDPKDSEGNTLTATKTYMRGDGIYKDVTFQITGSGLTKTAQTEGVFELATAGNPEIYLTLLPGNVTPIFKRVYNGKEAFGTPGKANLQSGYIYRDKTVVTKGIKVEMSASSEGQIEEQLVVVNNWNPGEQIELPTQL